MLESRRIQLAIAFSSRLQNFGDSLEAESPIGRALDVIDLQQQSEVALHAAMVLRNSDSAEACRLIERILSTDYVAAMPEVWRYEASLAESAGESKLALNWLEQAVLLEYAALPDEINLQQIRANYSALLA